MNVNDLSPELRKRALECKSNEELFELAKNEGVELSDEQLESLSGGKSEWDCNRYDLPILERRED